MSYKFSYLRIRGSLLLLLLIISLNSVSQDVYTGEFSGYSYNYSKINHQKKLFEEDDNIEVLYFFNYKCPFSYKYHNMMSVMKKTIDNNNHINFYNIPLSKDYSLDLFLLGKKFKYSFSDEIIIYENFLKEIKSENHNSLEQVYASTLNISVSAVYEILNSKSFNDEKEFISSILNQYNVDSTPYAIIIGKNNSYVVRGNDNIEPINFTLSISRVLNKIN